jgi:hypothetical protein
MDCSAFSHAVALCSELCKSHVHHQLALGRMTGNMSLARSVLRQHYAPRRESADIAVACLKFNLASEPKHEQTLRRIVPIYLAHTGGYVADVNRDSPDDSRTGVNIRAFAALQQD